MGNLSEWMLAPQVVIPAHLEDLVFNFFFAPNFTALTEAWFKNLQLGTKVHFAERSKLISVKCSWMFRCSHLIDGRTEIWEKMQYLNYKCNLMTEQTTFIGLSSLCSLFEMFRKKSQNVFKYNSVFWIQPHRMCNVCHRQLQLLHYTHKTRSACPDPK